MPGPKTRFDLSFAGCLPAFLLKSEDDEIQYKRKIESYKE